jgi:thiol:disulfide interchange protein
MAMNEETKDGLAWLAIILMIVFFGALALIEIWQEHWGRGVVFALIALIWLFCAIVIAAFTVGMIAEIIISTPDKAAKESSNSDFK